MTLLCSFVNVFIVDFVIIKINIYLIRFIIRFATWEIF